MQWYNNRVNKALRSAQRVTCKFSGLICFDHDGGYIKYPFSVMYQAFTPAMISTLCTLNIVTVT